MKQLRILALVVIGLLTACGAAAEKPGALRPYTSQLTTLTFSYPENWAVTENPDAILIASNENTLTTLDNTDATIISITLIPGVVPAPTMLTELLQPTVQSLLNQEEVKVLAEAEVTTLNNQMAGSVALEATDMSGLEVVVRAVSIAGPDQVALITAVTDKTRYDNDKEAIEAFLNSIIVGPLE